MEEKIKYFKVITGHPSSTIWYNNFIGKIFKVIQDDRTHYKVIDFEYELYPKVFLTLIESIEVTKKEYDLQQQGIYVVDVLIEDTSHEEILIKLLKDIL